MSGGRRASNVEAVRRASSPLLRRLLNDSLETLADKVFHYRSPRRRVDVAGAGAGGAGHARHPRGLGRGGPILSSLPLQVLLYYSAILYPAWVIGMLTCLAWKTRYFYLGSAYMGLSWFLVALFTLAEPGRLYLGYGGNLHEQLPELAGLFLVTLFPQLPITVYFLLLQPVVDGGFALPFELALNAIYLILLLPQPVLAYGFGMRLLSTNRLDFERAGMDGVGVGWDGPTRSLADIRQGADGH